MSVVEKEAKLRKMMEDELETKSNHHTPEGLFTKPTQDIVDGLLKDAHGDEELALRRITFYINRAGDGLSNKTAVNAAKRELEKKAEAKREAKNIQFHNMLSEYFGEAYTNMFEDDKENKRMPKRDAFWYLLNNDINLAWMLGAPHPELIDPKRKKVLGLFDVMQNGKLKMLTHKNDQEHGYKAKWVDEDIYITPEEFKDIIDADINNETNAPWTKEINDHYRDVEEEKSILKSGEQLFNAWINRFYEENKDELGLKSPKDKRTYDAFVNWWNKQTDYTRRNYAPGVSDIWDLATLDVHRGMPIIRIRQRAMARNLNSKTISLSQMGVPQLATDKEKDTWEKYQVLSSIAERMGMNKKDNPGFYNAIEATLCDSDGQNINPSKDRVEYWKERLIGSEPEEFAVRMYPNPEDKKLRAQAAAEKRAEIIEDNPDLDEYAELMAKCEKLYESQVRNFNRLEDYDDITQEDINSFENVMKLPGAFDDSQTIFDKEYARQKYGVKHDISKLIDPEELEKRVDEFESRFPGYIEKLNKWEQDVNNPDVIVRRVIVSSNPWVLGDEVAKRVGKNSDGTDRWEIVTDEKEKQDLIAKKTAKKPTLDISFSDNPLAVTKSKEQADKERHEKIKNCLAQYGDEYEQFADKPISDGKDMWKIVDVVESPYGGQPKFQIASLSNPAFSSVMKKVFVTATGPNRSGILDWIDNYNETGNEKPEPKTEPDDEEDEVDPADVAKYADQLKKHFESSSFINSIKDVLSENGYVFDEKKTKVISDPKTGVSVSKDEDYIYDKLKEKYGEVKRQYKDEERYPWDVDFYIPSEDLFIEYLKHWTHGRRVYNPEDPECQADVKWLKSKADDNEFYKRCLDQWTVKDPEKMEVARENGLNLVVLYNLREFDRWFEHPDMQYRQYRDPDPLQYDSEDYFAKKAQGYDPYGNDAFPYDP